jgi:predicted permease
MVTLLQDIRHALRQLRRSPGFTITAIITLALGIGANVVVFGVLQTMLLRPIETPHPDQVVNIEQGNHGWINISYPEFQDIRDRSNAFSEVAAYRIDHYGVEAGNSTRPVWGYEVTGQYFNLLRVQPLLGRMMQPADDAHPGASHAAVLSYGTWKDLYHGDQNIVGKSILIDKQPYTVIGVTPKNFSGTEKFFSPGIYLPMSNENEFEGFDWLKERGDQNIWGLGRIKDGITKEQANANLKTVAASIAKDYPKTDENLLLKTGQPGFLGDMMGGPIRGFMGGVMLLACLVLLAACANLGSLFAARTADRTREFAIRLAIGSSRWRVLRQILTEAIVVSIGGGIVACGLATVLLRGLGAFTFPTEIPIKVAVGAEPSQIAVAFGVALLAGVLFGMVPVRQIFAADPNQAIKGGITASAGGRRWAIRDILLAAQIALCCLVVTAAFVSLRGLGRTLTMQLGFQPRNVVTTRFDLQLAHYNEKDGAAFQRKLLDSVKQIPGVEMAAYANTTPLSLNSSNTNVYDEQTTDFRPSTQKFLAGYYNVSPGYFATAGTHLLAGREFTWNDTANTPRVAVVNQEFARRLFGTDQAVGRYFKQGNKEKVEIVGVVEDGKYTTLTEDPTCALFRPILRATDNATVMMVRSSVDPILMSAAVRKAVHDLDANVPIEASGSWQDQLGIVLFPARAATIALGIFGVLALLLSVTGTFGLASYTVAKRLRELSIRVALGAQSKQIIRAALGRTLLLLTCGSIVGLILGVAATRVLSAVVAHASAQDPVVLIAVALTMLLAGSLSVANPARRALKIDPARLLRED